MKLSTAQALAPYAPRQGEAAILSLIAVREDNVWLATSLSLLTVEASQATESWERWNDRQPQAKQQQAESGFDLGPVFDVQPFEGVRALRQPVSSLRWAEVAEQVGRGRIEAHRACSATCRPVVARGHVADRWLLGSRESRSRRFASRSRRRVATRAP